MGHLPQLKLAGQLRLISSKQVSLINRLIIGPSGPINDEESSEKIYSNLLAGLAIVFEANGARLG